MVMASGKPAQRGATARACDSDSPFEIRHCQAADQLLHGIEVHPVSAPSTLEMEAVLTRIARSGGLEPSLKFVVMHLPPTIKPRELDRVMKCSRQVELIKKLCFVCQLDSPSNELLFERLHAEGARIILGGVGLTTRVGDLTNPLLTGFSLEAELICAAEHNLRFACVLNAITSLAANLGALTFATGIESHSASELAWNSGVDYVTTSEYRFGRRTLPKKVTV